MVKTPFVVATGFTTAFLGDERTLREFIVGDHIIEKIAARGMNAALYLINDSYDPLTERQLRVAVNKNDKLIKQFTAFCGRPIAEIPDPFGCHQSYSQHFARALEKRLHSLGIHPTILDSYQAYQRGHYSWFIRTTFENYDRIRETLSAHLERYTMRNLFRAQCPKCQAIDATNILDVKDLEIRFDCERCGNESVSDLQTLRGKLSWKLDCAARWNLYGIDLETFSKAHIAELGTLATSQLVSRHFFGGVIPTTVKYGEVKLSRELSNRLIEILPPRLLKTLFVTRLTRDLDLTKDFVENFCQKAKVRPGISYVDFVRRDLPQRAIREEMQPSDVPERAAGHDDGLGDDTLVAYGNRFARFFYKRDHGLRAPDVEAITSVEGPTAEIARRIILHALSVRTGQDPERKNAGLLIKSNLLVEKASPEVYRYLRRVFRQTQGPHISTLLAILPEAYLDTVQQIIALHCRVSPASQATEQLGLHPVGHAADVADSVEAEPASAFLGPPTKASERNMLAIGGES